MKIKLKDNKLCQPKSNKIPNFTKISKFKLQQNTKRKHIRLRNAILKQFIREN